MALDACVVAQGKGAADEVRERRLRGYRPREAAEQNACQRRNGGRYAQFYSAQQRFFLQLMMAYALPDVIPEIDQLSVTMPMYLMPSFLLRLGGA